MKNDEMRDTALETAYEAVLRDEEEALRKVEEKQRIQQKVISLSIASSILTSLINCS